MRWRRKEWRDGALAIRRLHYATMEGVETAKMALARAESHKEAIARSIAPARASVIAARKAAVVAGFNAFQEHTRTLAQERAALLEQLRLVDGAYEDVKHSFQQTDNPASRFLPMRLDSKNDYTTGYDVALSRYLHSGLSDPNEKAVEVAPREVILAWRTER